MKNKAIKYTVVILVLAMTLLVSINLDRIKFGLSLVDIYRKTPTMDITDKKGNENSKPSIEKENPLDKILEDDDEDYIKVEHLDKENEIKPLDNVNQAKGDLSKNDSPKEVDLNQGQALNDSKKSITERYNKDFKFLQSEFEKDLNSLIGLAYKEYSSGTSSNSQLASKYLDQGVALEKSADARFYSLLNSYQEELKNNSYDTSIIKELENYYESFKKDRKSEIISKGMEIVRK